MDDRRTITLTNKQLEQVVEKAVTDTFLKMGIDSADPIEMQKDMQHLRQWRESTESIKTKSLATIIGFVIVGGLGLLLSGIMDYIKTH